MTVTLELRPDTEAAAKAAAQAEGIRVENYLQSFLEQALPRLTEEATEHVRRQRTAVLERLQGKHAGLPGGSEAFAAQKEEEKAREERRWRGPQTTRNRD